MSEEEKLREELELVRCDLHNAYSILDGRNEEIERLNKEVERYKKRCYEALMLIRENYGVLDKYGIDMLDDILNGK